MLHKVCARVLDSPTPSALTGYPTRARQPHCFALVLDSLPRAGFARLQVSRTSLRVGQGGERDAFWRDCGDPGPTA